MKTIALITARGGSKRIPKKNIKEFCGKPIIAYSIEAALQSGLFDEVMVSTDSEEIRDIAHKYGAKVPFLRSAETSSDYATSSDVIMEVVNRYEEMGIHFDYGCCIYPTAPFVTAARLAEAMNKIIDTKADSLIPVVQFSFPPLRGVVMNGDRITMKWPEFTNSRSQDLEKIYHDCGQFYAFNVEAFKKNKSFWAGDVASIEIPEVEVQDIDTNEDWELAELKYKYLHG